MHSILTIMAIKAVAPAVRTVAEVNNPRHEPHFRRADVDELLVTLQGGVAPAGALGAVPRADRRWSPTSCPAARARSSTGSRCPTRTSA